MAGSAASQSTNGHIDMYENSEYPIILGDSLKMTSSTQSRFVQMRYNWTPSRGFRGQKGSLKDNGDGLQLTYKEDSAAQPVYEYSGFYSPDAGGHDGKGKQRIALFFDPSKSAFVLEEISTVVDLNVTSAASMSRDDIRRQQRLQRSGAKQSFGGQGSRSQGGDDEEPDSSNPFDFRHFLSEAKEAVEKAAQPTGSRTPIPGNSTPHGNASPSIPGGGGRFAPSTSIILPSASTPTTSTKSKATDRPSAKSMTSKRAPAKRKEAPAPKSTPVLSKERISDSDDELSDANAAPPKSTKGHTRNQSSASAAGHSSNNIVYHAGGLEIEDASPPQEPRRRYKIDTEAFRSGTHTPVQSGRTNNHNKTTTASASAQRMYDEDIIMDDVDRSEKDQDEDEDEDVEEFQLDSHHTKKGGADGAGDDSDAPQSVETPPGPAALPPNDDDDDELMELEFMKALEEAEDDEAPQAYGHVDDDESEISEEE